MTRSVLGGSATPVHIVGAETGAPVNTIAQIFTSFGTGELLGSATPDIVQMPDIPCSYVKFKAQISNVGNVYYGNVGVTIPQGTTNTTTGWELVPGGETGWRPVSNLNLQYYTCDNAGDGLIYEWLA